MTPAQHRLAKLAQLWEQEREASRSRFVAARAGLGLKDRVRLGLAMADLAIDEEDVAPGGRTLLWLAPRSTSEDFGRLAVRVGEPVRLWWDDPEEEGACLGTVARRSSRRLGVMVDGVVPERLDDGGFRLDVDDSDATFDRGRKAIRAFLDAPAKHREADLREILFGERAPSFSTALEPLDLSGASLAAFGSLNDAQKSAVRHALAAKDVALIHGPPGTGKTTTLAGLIACASARGDAVLATAASNMAVDNLVAALNRLELNVVRVGHPARVSDAVMPHTLASRLERSPEMKLARGWIRQAHQLRSTIASRRSRGRADWAQLRAMRDEMRGLFADARRQSRRAEQRLLAEADVICSTAAGADSRILGGKRFDLVVVDEATQAADPVAMVALARAQTVILAGDPRQLPPTVIDPAAAREGLSETLFDRLLERHGDDVCEMLTVQYRMPEVLMTFPSESMYDGQLQAHASVADRTLADLPSVRGDALRPGALVFIDTAGKGWDESRQVDAEGARDDAFTRQVSVSNPGQAARMAVEVRRCLRRGVNPEDVAVITPYSAQRYLLAQALAVEVAAGLEVGTVDSFQGREKEAIFVDLVRSNPGGDLGFVADTRRMNVAITRAKRFLCVLADSATFGGHPYFEQFMAASERAGGWISAWSDDGTESL